MKHRKFWKFFLLALLTSIALTGGGVALYLYWTKYIKDNEKEIPGKDKNGKDNAEKELPQKLSKFINAIKKNNNELLTSIFQSKFEDGDAWDKVIKEIKDKLTHTWNVSGLQDIDINENLIITLNHKDKKLTGKITKDDVAIIKNIAISLNYKGRDNVLKEKIKNINIKLTYSLATRWTNFIASIDKLNDLSLTNFTNKNKWDDVLKAIREKLAIKFKEIFNNDSDLKIDLQDENNQKLESNKEIGLDYLAGKTIKIVLSHNKETSLTKSFTIDFNITKPKSLKTLWNAFIKAIIDKDNKFIGVNLVDWLDKKYTWKDLADYIKNKLKDKYENDYQLDNWVNNLDIKLFDEKKQEVIYNKLITKTNDYLIKTKIFVKVIHNKLDKDGKEASIDSFQLSEKARWKLFINNVENNNLLTSIDWKNVNKFTTWNKLAILFREKLTNTFENIYQLGGISKLDIKLFDESNPLTSAEMGKSWDKEIIVKLYFNNLEASLNIKIPIYPIFVKDLVGIIYEMLIKSDNKLDQFKKNFIAKLNSLDEYKEFNFVESDFDYDFKEATYSYNVASIIIIAKNKDKVRGKSPIQITSYKMFKLDFKELEYYFKTRLEKEPTTKRELEILLQNWFNTNDMYKKCDL